MPFLPLDALLRFSLSLASLSAISLSKPSSSLFLFFFSRSSEILLSSSSALSAASLLPCSRSASSRIFFVLR